VVWRWRKALGVGRADPEGSRVLIRAAAGRGAQAMRARGVSPAERQARRETALRLDLARHLRRHQHTGGRPWAEAELRLLGRVPDAELAGRLGRSVEAIRIR
jgi:hypothetical protein